ncbi:hypothetical protein [Nitrospira sp. Nam74]
MKKISKADIKKAILAVEAERLKQPVVSRPDYAKYPKLVSSRRASERMVSEFLRNGGLDTKKFEALQVQRSAELQRIVGKHKADALQRASRQKDTLHSSILEQSKALRSLASKGDFFPYPSFSLDTPFLIWTTPLLALDSAAVPFGSWAKFKIATSKYQGTQKVGFYFYWANPYADYAVISASTFMSATGHLKLHAPWTIGVNTSWVQASARFGLWFGFPQAASTDYESAFLGQTGAYAQTFIGGDTNAIAISAGVSLNKTMFAVPPGNIVIFEVALAVEYENDEGNIEADFESGDFKIACPIVVFSLMNSPPVVMGRRTTVMEARRIK